MSTRWRLYRETLPEGSHLEGEIVVGLPLSPEPVNTIQSNTAAAPFHLFFPTKISSGTPFLLHGYFELAARRASFYGGSEKQNRSLLQRLGRLVWRPSWTRPLQALTLHRSRTCSARRYPPKIRLRSLSNSRCLEVVRQGLMAFTHPSHHHGDIEYTREDAVALVGDAGALRGRESARFRRSPGVLSTGSTNRAHSRWPQPRRSCP